MTNAPPASDVAAARRLLGLDAHADPGDVEAAVYAARCAIVVPDDSPELSATAAHLHRRLDHARAVLLATAPPAAGPVPPTPPTPPVQMARVQPNGVPSHAAATPSPAAPSGGPDGVAPTRGGRPVTGRRRSEFSRAGVQAVAIVAVLLILGGGAFAVTRALSRSGGSGRPTAPASSATTTTPPTTLAAKPLPARLVAGELGHPAQGIDAPSAAAALSIWLRGFQGQDSTTVSLGIADESRLPDLAEIGAASTASDLDAVSCNVFGSGTWVCRVGRVTSARHKVEVAGTPAGWRVLGWFG